MADEFGLLPEGFVRPTIPEIRDEMEADVRVVTGASTPLGDDTFDGHLIGILSERLGLLWELGEICFSSMDRDKAAGDQLRSLGALTGTFELPALPSTVTETLCGDDASVIPAGTIIATDSTGRKFQTALDETLEQLDDWAALGSYIVDDRVTNSNRCYVCITAGVAAGAGGPTTTDADITDGTVHWQYIGEGQAAADVKMTSLDNGAVVAIAGDLTDIQTPVGGLNTAVNLHDADLGRDVQNDESFRLLVEEELTQAGTGPADAVRAALLKVPGVTNATVFFNNTDVTDDDGLTPHSTECLVQGGADQDIWDCLWNNVPLGIQTIGDEVGTVEDSEGFDQTLKFSRPEEFDIYIIVDLVEDPKTYGGDTTVKAAIVAWGNAQKTGKDVVASAISAQCFRVAGVLDVTSVKIDTAPAPSGSATIAISLRQLADYDTARISIVTSDGVP
jgi:uncharacterized phage protein gp47/JayE